MFAVSVVLTYPITSLPQPYHCQSDSLRPKKRSRVPGTESQFENMKKEFVAMIVSRAWVPPLKEFIK